MEFDIKKVDYYNVTAEGHAGGEARVLSAFAGAGVNLLAYRAVPAGSGRTRFSLFPNDSAKMIAGGKQAGLELDGPHAALLIWGDDESGALADIFDKLSIAGIVVSESNGIANINGGYGVVLYIRQEDSEKALAALQS